MPFIFLTILFFSQASFSRLLEYDVVGSDKRFFELKNVCERMGHLHVPIIEISSMNEIDCMGKKVNIIDFCLQDFKKDQKFIRGFADKKEKKIICELASRVMLKLECDSKNDMNCMDSEIGCTEYKKTLAYNLKLAQHSLLDQNDKLEDKKARQKVLTCHFTHEI